MGSVYSTAHLWGRIGQELMQELKAQTMEGMLLTAYLGLHLTRFPAQWWPAAQRLCLLTIKTAPHRHAHILSDLGDPLAQISFSDDSTLCQGDSWSWLGQLLCCICWLTAFDTSEINTVRRWHRSWWGNSMAKSTCCSSETRAWLLVPYQEVHNCLSVHLHGGLTAFLASQAFTLTAYFHTDRRK